MMMTTMTKRIRCEVAHDVNRKSTLFEPNLKFECFSFSCQDDDDDGDDNIRTVILPECVVDEKNYLRCDPFTMKKRDEDTCEEINDEVCAKGHNKRKGRSAEFEEEYCQCIGLEYVKAAQLRGATNA